jgi:hypothetical protein
MLPLFAAIKKLSLGTKLLLGSNVVQGVSQYIAAKEQRKQAIRDQDNQFVRMRNAAERAGFNPLTVLRATGGQGFTGLPVISKVAAFGNAATGILDAVRQAPIDKYNAEIRELEKALRKADLELMPMRGKLMKAQINDLYSASAKNTNVISNKQGNNPETTNSRTAVTSPLGTTSPANVSDAEAYEQRYGDIVQEVAGLGILMSDLYKTGLISAATAFGKKPSFNNPERGQMVKKRLETGILSRPLGRTTPGFGEQWSMYAP